MPSGTCPSSLLADWMGNNARVILKVWHNVFVFMNDWEKQRLPVYQQQACGKLLKKRKWYIMLLRALSFFNQLSLPSCWTADLSHLVKRKKFRRTLLNTYHMIHICVYTHTDLKSYLNVIPICTTAHVHLTVLGKLWKLLRICDS